MNANRAAGDPAPGAPTFGGGTSSLRRWAIATGIVLVVLIIAADTHEAWQDYHSALQDNERTQLALGRVLSEQVARMMQEVDVVLSDLAVWTKSPDGRVADESTVRERLRSDVGRLPFVYSAALAGADGRVRATTQSESTASLRRADSEGMRIPAPASKNALYIGQNFIGSRDGARTFALSRRIDSSAGAFAGVVVARVAFEYLTGFHAGVNATPGTSIRLLRQDGTVLAQYPASTAPIPDDMYVRRNYSGVAPVAERVRYSTSNGRQQVATLRMVEGYPIVVEVIRPLDNVLQSWVRYESGSAARTLTLAALAGALLMALQAALRRHDRMENERRRLERDLQNAQRLDVLGFLAASVAHDFNNVLAAIVGYGELARRSMAADTADRDNMDRLLAAADRARLLVRRVLTFNFRRSVTYQPLSINMVIDEVVQQVQATVPPSVTVSVSGLETPATILGDATEIHQVVMNLCSNAVHAMPSGGKLDIRIASVQVQEAALLTIGELHPGPWIFLSISDTGCGLTQAQRASIFEPFYTTRQPEHGTGIGLTVVRNIMTRMHGALAVESEVGVGTRMSVYWPSIVAPPLAESTPESLPPGRGETVLVVDDMPELVALAEDLLASLGYEPVGFTAARAALDALQSDPDRFDAVVTDERMHQFNGCDLAKFIHRTNPKVPVILVTAYRDAALDERAKEASIAAILDKPLRVQTLSAALRRHLAVAKA